MARREIEPDLRDLMAALDYTFQDPELLRIALLHPSAVSTGRGKRSKKPADKVGRSADNQRLEFLGDRVLGIVIAEMLFRAFPDEDEGALARRLAALVRQDSLDTVAREIALGRYLTISRGEDEGGGRDNPAILADACEALIGAVYLDGGLEAARSFVERHWRPKMDAEAKPPQDAKTALQEWAQAAGLALPLYTVVKSEGPPHDPVFEVEVTVAGQEPASARGRSKRAAEQAAARQLLDRVGA
ncbi:ribonuclease III [Dongia sedimenti]|uniref:Ribonuclease 3 n=1 Tax=Dongia sedimenti TaxID=3064282 RepID=A0ABU0YSR3_9PROT|nr:ribonuclease III [Rhodospirillaceae bacterium R-7]